MKKCKKCASSMVLINGRKGRFYGCSKWNKGKGCNYTENIEYLPLEVVYFDFNKFIQEDPCGYLLDIIRVSDVRDYIKELEISLDGRELIEADLEAGSPLIGKISGLLDYLMKNNLSFDLAKVAYYLHRINKSLHEKHAYFLNHETSGKFYREYDITTAVLKSWDTFSMYIDKQTKAVEFEQPLMDMIHLSGRTEGYIVSHNILPVEGTRVDIAAFTKDKKYLIFEFKGPTGDPFVKGRQAGNQMVGYMHELIAKEWDVSQVSPYTVVRGYSGSFFDEYLPYTIKSIGYVIQDGKIMFIPWD